MREGRLGYNCENGRYGLLVMDLWIDTGFHCGECMEVLVDDQWVQTRMEMNLAREWYLVGTPYCGDLEYIGQEYQIKSDREIEESEIDNLLSERKNSPDTGIKTGRIRPR